MIVREIIEFAGGIVLPVQRWTITESIFEINAEFETIVEGDHWQEQLSQAQGELATLRVVHGDTTHEFAGIIGSFDVEWVRSFDTVNGPTQSWRLTGRIRQRRHFIQPAGNACQWDNVYGQPLCHTVTHDYEFHRIWFDAINRAAADRAAADARAESLLLAHLDPEQRAEYESAGTFTVAAPSGRRYRLRKARSFNVDELDRKGSVRQRLCTVPGASVPMADQLLAQKFWLEADEKRFRKTANKTADRGAWEWS